MHPPKNPIPQIPERKARDVVKVNMERWKKMWAEWSDMNNYRVTITERLIRINVSERPFDSTTRRSHSLVGNTSSLLAATQ